ncbi:hypothetical protein GF325_05420 [Candidatus Bathyarchaeota archaeon]|nr:hypothetical protein [Candidatus Bathyarchaeota archaeon]
MSPSPLPEKNSPEEISPEARKKKELIARARKRMNRKIYLEQRGLYRYMLLSIVLFSVLGYLLLAIGLSLYPSFNWVHGSLSDLAVYPGGEKSAGFFASFLMCGAIGYFPVTFVYFKKALQEDDKITLIGTVYLGLMNMLAGFEGTVSNAFHDLHVLGVALFLISFVITLGLFALDAFLSKKYKIQGIFFIILLAFSFTFYLIFMNAREKDPSLGFAIPEIAMISLYSLFNGIICYRAWNWMKSFGK